MEEGESRAAQAYGLKDEQLEGVIGGRTVNKSTETVYLCPQCGEEASYWHFPVNTSETTLRCPWCKIFFPVSQAKTS